MIVGSFILVAQLLFSPSPTPAPAKVNANALPIQRITLRDDWLGCPTSRSNFHDSLFGISPIIVFDCPVAVLYKTFPDGRRVHIGIRSTRKLHPGPLKSGESVQYELGAPTSAN